MATVPGELLFKEMQGFGASYEEAPDEAKALTAGGECAQRISDMPRVEELIGRIIGEAEEVLRLAPSNIA